MTKNMKNLLAAGVAFATLASVAASPAFAAPLKHRAPVSQDLPYGQVGGQMYAGRPDVVTLGSRVVGEDPDANIRSQMLHDPAVSEY